MKPFYLISLSLVAISLVACAQMPTWHHPDGKSVSDYNHDLADCRYQWSLLTTDSDTPYIIPEPDDHQGPLGLMMANASMDSDFEIECMEKKGWVRQK